jgi:hypothetical protein
MIKVVEELGVSFEDPLRDPMAVARKTLAGTSPEEEQRDALEYRWGVIYEKGIGDFLSKDALKARLAVVMLSPCLLSQSESWMSTYRGSCKSCSNWDWM